MVEYIPGLKKMFILTLSVCVCLLFFVVISYDDDYYINKFDIKINNVKVNARYRSVFKQILFVKSDNTGRIDSYEEEKELFVEIPVSDKYKLSFNEYEAYNKYNQREDHSFLYPSYEYKKVTNSKNKLKIERLNKVLYDGEFKSDISDIISGPGRYYFHIYNNSKRAYTPFARVNTMLTFNVLVVDHED